VKAVLKDIIIYHTILAEYFNKKPLYISEIPIQKPNIRKVVELPFQQTNAGLWDEVTNTLCNLDFIQAKAAAERTFDLIKDFNELLKSIPDNQKFVEEAKKEQGILDKYALDLVACAKGKLRIDEIDIPESSTPWTNDQIDVEVERLKSNPDKVDRLKDFLGFLGKEAYSLQTFAKEIPFFAHQQAWNFAAEGPVGLAAEKSLKGNYRHLVLRTPETRLSWSPRPQIIKLLYGHTKHVKTISISTDGKVALTGSSDKTCILWDLATGEALNRLAGHTAEVLSIAISSDRKRAFSGSNDHTCIHWDLTTGKALKTYRNHVSWVYAVAMTPDGTIAISGSEDKTCIIWDLTTGEAQQTLRGHDSGVQVVAISPDGNLALSGSFLEGTCKLWDLRTSQALLILNGIQGVHTLVPAPDWKMAFIGTMSSIFVWDLTDGKVVKKTSEPCLNYKTFVITPDKKMALCGSYDKVCDLWDLNSWQVIKTFSGHAGFINAVSITPNGEKAISASEDQTCILWDITKNKELEKLNWHDRQRNRIGIVIDIAINPVAKTVLSTFSGGNRKFWDLNTGQVIKKIRGLFDDQKIALTPDGKMIISGNISGHCVLYDFLTGAKIQELIGHYQGRIHALVITPGGKFALSTAEDNYCIIYDLNSRKVLRTLFRLHSHVTAIAVSPDGKIVLSVSLDNICNLWEFTTGKVIKSFKVHNNPVSSISMAPDGKTAFAGCEDGTCILLDLIAGTPIIMCKGHNDFVSGVVITQDGKLALSGSYDNCIIIWDLETGKKMSNLFVSSKIRALRLSGNRIITGCESGEVIFLNVDMSFLRQGPAITTIRKIWDSEIEQFLDLSADCPLCGHRFAPPSYALDAIKDIITKAALTPDQSSCLELPDEAWLDFRLESKCPECGDNLKFNPFTASEG